MSLEHTLKSMDRRARATKVHNASMHAIYTKWAQAHYDTDSDGWQQVAKDIEALIVYLNADRKQFPNIREHLAQWDLLYGIALERHKESMYP